jgi:Polyketide cyclase / dehydrase and lipid transport
VLAVDATLIPEGPGRANGVAGLWRGCGRHRRHPRSAGTAGTGREPAGRPLTGGERARGHQTRIIPRRSEEGFEVTDFVPPSRLAVSGQIGPFRATSSYLLEPTAGGTRLTNDVELEPSSALLRPIGPLAVPAVKAAVARNLGTLKQLLEGARPTPEGDKL